MPGPADFNTPQRIIAQAMKNCGLLQKGQEPDSEDYAEYMPVLNDLINLKQTQGLKLWLQTDQSITLTAGVSEYLLGPGGSILSTKPMRVLNDGYYLDVNNVSRPIFAISKNEYYMLSTRTQQGPITQFYVDKQELNLNVWFWLTPDDEAATGTAHLIVQNQVTNMVQLNDTLNFPQEWFMALHWGLADEISTGQPVTIMERCQQKAAMYFQLLEDWDVEDPSTRIQPDSRGQAYSGRFK